MEKTVLAFEIKCPVPKDYAIDAHYEIPHYYICQILSEMLTLKCDKLYFVILLKVQFFIWQNWIKTSWIRLWPFY